jgi:aryl-alcohol dehydrogenase-like predicted oxidoreductase
MEYRKLGRTGLKVSAFCLGTMTFRWTCDEAESFRILDTAWDSGINFLDTADIYSKWAEGNPGGVSEEVIGRWLKTKPREQVVVATKCAGEMWKGPNGEGLSRQHIMHAVEMSLRRLQTDFIDLYQVHWADYDTPLDETLRALDSLVQQGKVRYIGASNYRAWYLMKSLWVSDKLNIARFDSIQPHFHLLNRAEVEPELAQTCLDQGIGVIPYSPLAGGFLTGKYTRETPKGGAGSKRNSGERYANDKGFAMLDLLAELGKAHNKTQAEIALAWQLNLPFITAPIVGASNADQLRGVLGAVGLKLSQEEMLRFDQLTGIKRDYLNDWD